MLTLETLTENELRNQLGRGTVQKGEAYLKRLQECVRRGRNLQANVSGSSLYKVETGIEGDKIWGTCTCPYTWGDSCKHIAAVWLGWIRTPHTFRQENESDTRQTIGNLEVIAVAHPPGKAPGKLPSWMSTTWATELEQTNQTLSRYLEQLRMQDLREMAGNLGWTLKGNTKANLVSQFINLLTDTQNLRQIIGSLNVEHQQILWMIAILHPDLSLDGENLLKLAQHWGPLKQYKKADTYLKNWREKGVTVFGNFFSYSRSVDVITEPVMRPLSLLMAEQLPEARHAPPSPPAKECHLTDTNALLQAITQLLLLWEQNTPTLRPRQPRPAIEKIYRFLADWAYIPQEIALAHQEKQFVFPHINNLVLTIPPPELALPDETLRPLQGMIGNPEYINFVYHLMVAVGLLQPGDPVRIWSAVRNQFLRLSSEQQQAVLVRAYLQMSSWHEVDHVLRHTPALQLKRRLHDHQYKPEHLHSHWSLTRHQLLRVLACLPDDQWITWEHLSPLFRHLWPIFHSGGWNKSAYAHHENNNPRWYFTVNDQRTGAKEWDLLQGQVLQTLIIGPLRWLGLADVHLRDNQLSAFRFHGLGELYWNRKETVSHVAAAKPTITTPSAAAVHSTGETIQVNPTTVSPQGHHYLEQIAHLDQAQPGQFVYRLNRNRVHQAFENGHTLHELQKGWREQFQANIPQAINDSLTRWWQSYGQIRLYEQVSLIELADDYALAELKAVTSLKQYIIAELSPRLVLIPQTAIEPLQAELQKAGYTPKVEEQ